MNRKALFLLLFAGIQLATQSITIAQTTNNRPAAGVEKNQYKINFLMPGLGFEHGLSDKITIGANLGVSPVTYERKLKLANGTEKNESVLMGALQLEAQGRYYYNLNKRARKGLNTSGNSGNYFALSSCASRNLFTLYDEGKKKNGSAETNNNIMPDKYSYNVGLLWGLQRTYNNLFLNLEAGVIYQMGNGQNTFAPGLNLKAGYILFR
ncbi:hypothetical protein [Pedobacter steynii]|uniref:Outer membrane protein beta-barrel domain-containing protein n=1 Tax=Pedobacter steynii TaxID=430522 RepID=A0A1D7QN59_9SPHI|nr:hypothetical protein [Pedobacter steynii]AOM80102.1 hypothetical protein BFS30_24825 [Pedobacter steynii]